MELFVLIGLPASGKSTFAKEFCNNNENYVRLNRDDIRSMLCVDNSYSKHNENLVVQSQLKLLDLSFKKGFNVVLDNTNFNPDVYKLVDVIVRKYNVDVTFKYFNTPIEICLERNKNRDRKVPEDVIYNFYNKFVRNKTEEEIIQFLCSKTSSFLKKFEPFVYDKYQRNEFKNAIIVDIDGTIALANNRNIFDYSKVHTDTPRIEIIKIIRGYTDYYDDINVIVTSGRSADSKKETIEWLDKNFPFYRKLIMRNEFDMRCDTIVKEEMYLDYIKDKYNVLAVFDDRQKVVDMWRKNGLNVLQVAEGDF